ncbi:hypothetical protein IQ277_19450 [Nostocales cyanobacterium LEGE 12452]|nr:hypothetical protein [Nostocales cyanobacterium LEGE 12452]
MPNFRFGGSQSTNEFPKTQTSPTKHFNYLPDECQQMQQIVMPDGKP